MDGLVETARNNVVKFGEFDVARAPLLADTLQLAKEKPERVLKTFAYYDMIIRDLFTLTDGKGGELELIRKANTMLGKVHGADDFMDHMKEFKDEILDLVKHAGDLDNVQNQRGMQELTTKMNNAWEIKQHEPGWKPTDGDPRSDTVLWGFVTDALEAGTDIDFAIVHGIERILTQTFREKGIAYVNNKDWLNTALQDVVVLRGLQGHYPEKQVFDLWIKGRPEGLGWINPAKLNVYKELLGVK